MKRKRDASAAASLNHRRLIHELEVHQIELEMQNHALREDREQLEKSRARYAELYDFAPIGHLTLDAEGVITELNLACAALLGRNRRALRGRQLRNYVAEPSQPALDAHIRACSSNNEPLAVELMIPIAGGGFRTVEVLSAAPPRPPTSSSTRSLRS